MLVDLAPDRHASRALACDPPPRRQLVDEPHTTATLILGCPAEQRWEASAPFVDHVNLKVSVGRLGDQKREERRPGVPNGDKLLCEVPLALQRASSRGAVTSRVGWRAYVGRASARTITQSNSSTRPVRFSRDTGNMPVISNPAAS